jgi:hypothetical protein
MNQAYLMHIHAFAVCYYIIICGSTSTVSIIPVFFRSSSNARTTWWIAGKTRGSFLYFIMHWKRYLSLMRAIGEATGPSKYAPGGIVSRSFLANLSDILTSSGTFS